MKALFLAVALVAVGSPWASGQIMADPGTLTCEKWTGLREKHLPIFTDSVVAWMQGYFAGARDLTINLDVTERIPRPLADEMRASAQRAAHVLAADNIPGWLDAYCVAHPTEHVRSATFELLRQAYGRVP